MQVHSRAERLELLPVDEDRSDGVKEMTRGESCPRYLYWLFLIEIASVRCSLET